MVRTRLSFALEILRGAPNGFDLLYKRFRVSNRTQRAKKNRIPVEKAVTTTDRPGTKLDNGYKHPRLFTGHDPARGSDQEELFEN